jgi:hypothetical protein
MKKQNFIKFRDTGDVLREEMVEAGVDDITKFIKEAVAEKLSYMKLSYVVSSDTEQQA